ncbi:hypothetical protein F6V30_14065 [Oryzomonas sagensis]|uniref:Uncharacterized protein n=1 Tax=Oryzomonas sagensis TaxID=2603857 RepID=A0ABQ6TL19_9BACT|nr:hypothetical protein [Oryzomonas sagensis]KAB0668959.1 hypothetical protein F6V30_14065 [Oryzomonas sagensis]
MNNNEELKERARAWVRSKYCNSMAVPEADKIIQGLLAALEAAELDAECNRIQAVDRGNSFAALQAENAQYREALERIAKMDGENFPIVFAKCVDAARAALKEVQG